MTGSGRRWPKGGTLPTAGSRGERSSVQLSAAGCIVHHEALQQQAMPLHGQHAQCRHDAERIAHLLCHRYLYSRTARAERQRGPAARGSARCAAGLPAAARPPVRPAAAPAPAQGASCATERQAIACAKPRLAQYCTAGAQTCCLPACSCSSAPATRLLPNQPLLSMHFLPAPRHLITHHGLASRQKHQ